ncbi:MAG: MBL fold metallo-hydrolase [Anaerolineales bacterium]
MVQRERIAENVYFFQSETYAQVTAGVVAGYKWAVAIDTLPTPEETLEMRDFVEQQLGMPVRYVINTHYHADHAWGNCFFPGAMVIAHDRCRELLVSRGHTSLEAARKQDTLFRQVKLVLPHLTFRDGVFSFRVGKKTLRLFPLPGHSHDGVGVLVVEDRVLFAGDVFMPLPYIVDGNLAAMRRSLRRIGEMTLENVVQGHGDVILRGEVDGAVESNLAYLDYIDAAVDEAHEYEYPWDYLADITIEKAGKSHILLRGMASALHYRNLKALYRQKFGELPAESEFEDA